MPLVKMIQPLNDLKIRNPENSYRHLSAEGERVTWSTHWARAEGRGEIKVFSPEEEAEASKEPEAPKAEAKEAAEDAQDGQEGAQETEGVQQASEAAHGGEADLHRL